MSYLLEDILPHGHPMILLSEIKSVNDSMICALVNITSESMFYRQGKGVPAWVGLEYMGQTVAAFAGIKARNASESVKIGFLVSTRSYKPSQDYFPDGEYIVSAKPITFEGSGLQVFSSEIRKSSDIIVSANLNVYQPKSVKSYMELRSGK